MATNESWAQYCGRVVTERTHRLQRANRTAKAKGNATTKGNAITSRPELREQAREYLVVSGGEVVFSADNMGEAWAFRRGWGVDDSVLAVVVSGRGETLPVDLGDDPSN